MYGVSTIINIIGAEPVTLAEVKEHLRVDFDTDDVTILALIGAARGYCENYIGFILCLQTRFTLFTRFEDFKLYGPAVSIQSITYRNELKEQVTLPADDYEFTRSKVCDLYPADKWPIGDRIKVTYTAGYEPENVPRQIKQAMLLLIGDWYENPADSVRRFPTASKAILDMERVSIL